MTEQNLERAIHEAEETVERLSNKYVYSNRAVTTSLICGLVSLLGAVVLIMKPSWGTAFISGFLFIPAIVGIAASVHALRRKLGFLPALFGLSLSGFLFALLIWGVYLAFK